MLARTSRLLLTVPLLASAAIAQSAQYVEVPTSDNWHYGTASRDGEVSATFQTAFVVGRRWSPSLGIAPFGPTPSGFDRFWPWTANGDGSELIGDLSLPSGSTVVAQPVRWSTGAGFEVLPLPAEIPGGIRIADATPDMQTVVGSGQIGPGNANALRRAVRWSPGAPAEILGNLPGGGQFSDALACTPDGSIVVGYASATGTPARAFRWSAATGIVALPELPGVVQSQAFDVSADGTTIVGRALFGSGWRAVKWRPSEGMTVLGEVGVILQGTPRVIQVSHDGSTAVWAASGSIESWIWTERVGAMRLERYLEALGGSLPAGLQLREISSLSDDGDVVHGTASLNGQVRSGYRILLDDDPVGDLVCDPAVPNSTGSSGRLTAFGSDRVADDDLTLLGSGLPPNALALLIVAPATGLTPQPGGSQGVLCLGGQIGRFVPQAFTTSPWGDGGHRVDLGAIPGPVGVRATAPGDTWVFQMWHRDANPGATSNFTRAVSITFQ